MDASKSPDRVRAGRRGKRLVRRDRPYQPLLIVLGAVAAGIASDRYLPPAVASWLPQSLHAWTICWWLLAVICLATWWWLLRRGRNRAAAVALLLAVAATGATWHHIRFCLFAHDELARFARLTAAPVGLEGVALGRPQTIPAPPSTPLRAIPASERTRLRIRVVAIRDGTAWRSASGVVNLVSDGHLLSIAAGDRLRVFAQLRALPPTMNPGEFDYAGNARADRRLASLRCGSPDCVTVVARGGWQPRTVFDGLRNHAERSLWTHVGSERAGLANAILLGQRDAVSRQVTQSYLVTGTVHLLVVSGLHLGILASGLYALMRLGHLPRRAALAAIIVLIVLYAILAGGRPPVVRAAVLVVLVCAAAWMGHRAVAFNSLAAAALVVLAINPADLFLAGPQLSFLAVATLICFGNWWLTRKQRPTDPLDRLVQDARPWIVRAATGLVATNWWLLVATALVWVIALPLVMQRFHVVSLAAVLVSPFVWPLITLILYSGFVTLVLGWLLPPLAGLTGRLCDGSLATLEQLVQRAEQVPGAYWWTPGPATWWMLGFYGGLLVAVVARRPRLTTRWQLAALATWVLAGLTAPFLANQLKSDELACSFVALGHGSCAVLEAPGGHTLVYDAGSLTAPDFASATVAGYLWSRGITRIDSLVLSHADIDHYSAVPDLLDRFEVRAVYVSPFMFTDPHSSRERTAPAVVQAAIEAHRVPLGKISAGDRLTVGPDVVVEVLHPPRHGVTGSDNANSMTLGVEYAGRRILLPGDLEAAGLERVTAQAPYDSDILLAPHHGSRRSDPPGFAAWSRPEWVVISGGGGPGVAAVARTYAAAGARVLRTDQRGTVSFAVDLRGNVRGTTWR